MNRSTTALMALALTASGCAVQDRQPQPVPSDQTSYVTPDLYSNHQAKSADDSVREGRYRLVRTSPTTSQLDLLSQIVIVNVPTQFNPTVGDAIRHSLVRTGFSLCPMTERNAALYGSGLPASHYSIGPLHLRDALQVLGGPAWRVEVDEVKRTICYSLREGHRAAVSVAAVGEA